MTKNTKAGSSRNKPEIEIGGFFRSLGEAVDLLEKLVETGGAHARQGEFRVKGLGDKARGVYGFSIRTGLGGDSRGRSFRNTCDAAGKAEVLVS